MCLRDDRVFAHALLAVIPSVRQLFLPGPDSTVHRLHGSCLRRFSPWERRWCLEVAASGLVAFRTAGDPPWRQDHPA